MTEPTQTTEETKPISPPYSGQSFHSHQDWVNKATSRLTRHPQYNNTEHGDAKGWRGPHFTAMCFDARGRRCRNGGDFQRAEDEGAFPVWFVWPDQIPDLVRQRATLLEALEIVQEIGVADEDGAGQVEDIIEAAIAETKGGAE